MLIVDYSVIQNTERKLDTVTDKDQDINHSRFIYLNPKKEEEVESEGAYFLNGSIMGQKGLKFLYCSYL